MGAMAWARLCLEKSQKVLTACEPAQ